MWIVEAWFFIAMVVRALIAMPIGLALLALAAWIAWVSGGNWLLLLLAGWIGYLGGQVFFGTLASFVGWSSVRDPSTRRALRRSGMLRRD